MTPTVSIAISHTPWIAKRRSWIMQIRSRLAPTRPIIVPDNKRQGCWLTVLNAWRILAMQPTTHGLVLSDDLLPCHGFMDHLVGAITEKPDAPIAIQTGRESIMQKARDADSAWVAVPAYARGGGTILPRATIVDFLRFEEKYRTILDQRGQNDDSKLCLYFMARKITTWVTAPSLTEHLAPHESVMGNSPPNATGRVAAWFVDDLAPMDWSRGANGSVTGDTGYGAATRRTWKQLQVALEADPWL